MITNYYHVADHTFSVTADTVAFALMDNYVPFICNSVVADGNVFALTIVQGRAVSYAEELRQKEEDQEIVCGRTTDGHPIYEFIWCQQTVGCLVCSENYHRGQLILTATPQQKLAVDNALMVLFALSTAGKMTVLLHAAAVSHKDRGFIFLGKSGTGKSTHASLWVKYVEDAELVNDDNPVVRITDSGIPMVYGSPWSGKTPCYRNVSYPLGGIVLLSQAPHNKIERLKSLAAYSTLVTSISGQRWDANIADGLHATENALASTVPAWHLECLPDEEAARVCSMKIEKEE